MEREQDCRSSDKQREAINVTGALVYRICNLVCALYLNADIGYKTHFRD